MGMLHDAVVYLVEQLEGAKRCQGHAFRFHKQASQEDDLPVNPSGCARSEMYLRSVVFKDLLIKVLTNQSINLILLIQKVMYSHSCHFKPV